MLSCIRTIFFDASEIEHGAITPGEIPWVTETAHRHCPRIAAPLAPSEAIYRPDNLSPLRLSASPGVREPVLNSASESI